LALHGIKRYAPTLGRPTPWDGRTFAFVQDLVATEIQLVELGKTYFSRTQDITHTTIPATVERVEELWQASPDDELLGPFADNDANTRQCRTRRLMLVPPQFVPIVVSRRLTPRQLWTELAATIIATDAAEACAELMDWLVMAGCRPAAAAPSSLIMPMPHPPLADATLIQHRRSLLLRLLPGLAAPPATGLGDPNTARMADFVGQFLEDRREARDETNRRLADARAPKTVSQFWGDESCIRLCITCGVSSEEDLPPLWPALAAAGKKDRLAAERIIQAVACATGAVDQAPIVTPELVKNLVGLRFGDDLDDLAEGIQPFALAVRDHRSHTARALTDSARAAADEYDLATAGEHFTTLADARLMRTQKVTFPTDFIHAHAMLQAQHILHQALLGNDHPVTTAFAAFLHDYKANEMIYIGRMEPHGARAPTLLLRFVQLNVVNWFRAMRTSATLAPVPNFQSALTSMLVGNTSWVPSIPPRYLQPQITPQKVGSGPTAAPLPLRDTAAPAAAKTSAEVNLAKNAAFDKYKLNITAKTIKTAITTAGEPPVIKRDGKERPMCVSYHLKGLCYSTCKRQYDHQPHTAAEDEPLMAWCAVAYK
jgi:hypothetical protein